MTTISATIDDRRVRELLRRIVDQGQLIGPAMDSVGLTLTQRVALCFEDQRSPWGEPWEPLSDRTLKRRRDQGREGVSILRDWGVLLGSLSYQANYQGVDIRIGADDRPAAVHQFGSPEQNIPARPFLPVRAGDRVDLPAEWMTELLGVLASALEDA